jgi:hypothetical protein
MPRTHVLGGLSAAALATWLALPPSTAQEPDSAARERARARPETRLVPQRQWEYVQLPCLPAGDATLQRKEHEDRFNEQGKRGWEMVSLIEVQQPPARGCLLATFKRPVLN